MPRGVSGLKKPVRKTAKRKVSRRSPSELIADLKAKREDIMQSFGDRIGKLDQKIAELETRHAKRIQLHDLMTTKTPQELADEEAMTRKMLHLLRRAKKK